MALDWAVAGASVLGGLLSGHSARKNAEFQARLQRENWEYEQSNAHQLEVKDLKAAGLNPILSATNGQMASNMSVTPQDPSNWSGVMSSAVKAALEGQRLDNDLKRIAIEKDKADAEISKNKAETEWIKTKDVASAWQAQQFKAQTDLLQRELFEKVDLYELRWKLMEADIEKANAMVENLGALTGKYGAEAGLSYAKTAETMKAVQAGAFVSKFLPKDFVDTWIKQGLDVAMSNFEKQIGDVISKHINEVPTQIKGYFYKKWQDMNTPITGGDF